MMKKILSLLSVIAVVFAMSNIALADENNTLSFVEKEKTATTITLNLVATTNETLINFGGTIDISDALAKGATVKTFSALNGFTFNVNTTAKVITCSYLDTTGTTGTTGTLEFGTVTFDLTNVTEDITFAQKRALTAKNINSENVAGKFTNTAYTHTIKAPVVEDEPVTMDTPVAGNDMYGMKTALTEITFKNVADPVVKLEKDGVDSGKTYELPAGVKGGETAIIGIIRYAADVTGTFVLKVLDGTTEVASTTYVAE